MMTDKYQEIIDRERDLLKKKQAAIDKKYKKIELRLYFTFIIILAVITYFYYVCST